MKGARGIGESEAGCRSRIDNESMRDPSVGY